MTILYFSAIEALWLILINSYTIIHITKRSLRPGFSARLWKKKLVKKLKDCDVGSWRITRAFLAFDFFQTGVHFMNTRELFQLKH